VIFSETQLARGAEHAVGDFAPDSLFLYAKATGERCACPRERVQRAGYHHWRATDDVEGSTTAVVHSREPESIRVRVADRLHHPRYDHLAEIFAEALHAIDSGDVRGDEIVHLPRRHCVRDEGPQPLVREEHQANWERKRTSES
jgi:hypothetical protein